MLDPITLDQLRILATVAETGSFSAAARKLSRVQSAVSTAMANLEDQLAIPLWDRTQRAATLTDAGRACSRPRGGCSARSTRCARSRRG